MPVWPGRQAGDDCSTRHAARRRDVQRIGEDGLAELDAVDRDHFEVLQHRVIKQLQLQELLRGRVQGPPVFLHSGLHGNGRRLALREDRRLEIERQLNVGVGIVGRSGLVLLADDQHALGQSLGQGITAYHDQRRRRAAIHLVGGVPVNVRVNPVKARWLVGGNLESVLEGRIAGLDDGIDDVVLMTDRRYIQSVEVNVGRCRHHLVAAAVVSRARMMRHLHVDGFLLGLLARLQVLKIVGEVDHQRVAGIEAQRGRLHRLTLIHVDVTVVREALDIDGVLHQQVEAENAVLAIKIERVIHRRSGLRTVGAACLRGPGATHSQLTQENCEDQRSKHCAHDNHSQSFYELLNQAEAGRLAQNGFRGG